MRKQIVALILTLLFLLAVPLNNHIYAINSELYINLDPANWKGDGLLHANNSYVLNSNFSLEWQPQKPGATIVTRKFVNNWSGYNCIKFDCYSKNITNSWIFIMIGTSNNSYYYTYIILDWIGWKSFALNYNDIFSAFSPKGKPNINDVKYLAFQSHENSYMNIDKASIYLNNLRLSNLKQDKKTFFDISFTDQNIENNIFFTKNIIKKITELYSSNQNKFKLIFRDLINNSNKIYNNNIIDLSVIRDASLIAKITNNKDIIEIILNKLVKIDNKFWDNLIKENDILIQENIINYALVYDILKKEIWGKQSVLNSIKKNINYVCKIENDICNYWINYYPYGYANNHVTRASIASAITSLISFEPLDQRKKQFNNSINILDHFFNFQITSEGVLNEGSHYYVYLMEILTYFAHFLKNYSEINIFKDFSFSNKLIKLVEWSVKIRMPNGFMPCIDDAWQSKVIYPTSIIADFIDDSSYLSWNSSNVFDISSIENEPWNINKNFYAPLYLSTYNDNINSIEPSWSPSTIFPSDSQVILRESWKKDSPYLLMSGKNISSLHEHDDSSNLQIYAYESPILISSGYGPTGWSSSNRDYYVSSSAHNVIEVDGRGPKGYYNGSYGPIDTSNIYDYKNFSAISIAKLNQDFAVNFKDTFSDRQVYFINSSKKNIFYTLILDKIVSDKKRSFSVNYHPYGNLDKTTNDYSLYKSINNNKEQVTTKLLPVFRCETEIKDGFYSPYWGEEVKTKYIKYSNKGEKSLFCTGIFPYTNANTMNIIKESNINGSSIEFNFKIKMEKEDITDFFSFDEFKTIRQTKNIGTNSSTTYIRNDNLSKIITTFYIENGSYLNLMQKEIFFSNERYSYIYFSTETDLYKYYFEYELNSKDSKIYIKINDFEKILLDGVSIDFERDNKGVYINLPRGKHFLIFN